MGGEGIGARAARLTLVALAVVLVLAPASAVANTHCDASLSLNPGWRGATVQVTGDGFTPRSSISLYVDLMHAVSGSIDDEGEFAMTWQIPNDFPVGSFDYIIFDGFSDCDVTGTYTVNSGPPTTTAPSTTTTSTTTTTTTLAPTTTGAPATTVGTTTTTVADDTTTTTEADGGESGGIDPIVWILLIVIAILIAIVGYQFGVRRRSG